MIFVIFFVGSDILDVVFVILPTSTTRTFKSWKLQKMAIIQTKQRLLRLKTKNERYLVPKLMFLPRALHDGDGLRRVGSLTNCHHYW